MSQGRRLSPKNIKRIEIVLSTKDSVVSKNGYLKCRLSQENFQYVERLLWLAMMEGVSMKEKWNTLSVATCLSKEVTH